MTLCFEWLPYIDNGRRPYLMPPCLAAKQGVSETRGHSCKVTHSSYKCLHAIQRPKTYDAQCISYLISHPNETQSIGPSHGESIASSHGVWLLARQA
eukprot:3528071-Amphidinium_carterae.2